MKKMMVAAICLLSTIMLPAQGVYQLWGMTMTGGQDEKGVIFSTDGTGNNFLLKHQFSIAYPGANPDAIDLIEYNGKFYGMTAKGGVNGLGVIFEWDPSTNGYIKKFDFDGPDGSGPNGALTLKDGKFYGVTTFGGSNGLGVIFEWDPSTNIYSKKIDFDGANGSSPRANLTLVDGKFYGVTLFGGSSDVGVIFEWDPATNIYTKKKDFNDSDGRQGYGSLVLYNAKLYGGTISGGNYGYGVIFEWDPVSNIYSKKIDLDGTNGNSPAGDLAMKDAKFYGVTTFGGSHGLGVIYEWDPVTNIYTVKINLDSTSGIYPYSRLALSGGKFYGSASGGGANGAGTIFEWDPASNGYTKKIDLTPINGKEPRGSLTLKGGKFYGGTFLGGIKNKGVIFEWDPAGNVYSKKIDLNGTNGNNPYGSLALSGGKLYGMTNQFDQDVANDYGVIFEWDPVSEQYTKKMDFNGIDGANPIGSLTLAGGKFYGMTQRGGIYNSGVIFEWDPSTNLYTKKIDFESNIGTSPIGDLTMKGGKFYGTTTTGGIYNNGVIFEWDPATNIYSRKFSFNRNDNINTPGTKLTLSGTKFYGLAAGSFVGSVPNVPTAQIFEWDPVTTILTNKIEVQGNDGAGASGALSLCNCSGKFFGMTTGGGTNDGGVIFEWDPSTNLYTKKIDLDMAIGRNPQGSLTPSDGKFYGMTGYGGSDDKGVFFEWDPATNVYTKKKDFVGLNGAYPSLGNGLTRVPAPVAKGLPGSCVTIPAVTIDNSNNNKWVAITDDKGNAVAEIKANGNNLGLVNTSMYVHNGAVREDGLKRLFLDRNITITPQSQPNSPVDIRLYIRSSEYEALKNGVNSIGEPSRISTINDLGIFKKENNSCSSTLDVIANPVADSVESWQDDYVLSGTISSFSTFYFANKALVVLPLTLTEFNGRLLNNNGLLNWKISNELNTALFEVERSIDGRNYTAVGTVKSANTAGTHNYSFTDPKITMLGAPVVYYRLKQNDLSGRFTYSRIIALSINNGNIVLFYPNPVKDNANLTITINQAQQLKARVIDAAGKTISQQQWQLSSGSSSLSVDVSRLAKGIYYLELKGATVNERKQFSKQ